MSVWTMGETMVSLRADAPVVTSPTWSTHVAGAESNVAVGLARLGHAVRWCSRVGDDDFGRLITRELRAEGVDVAAEIDPSRPTGHMFLAPASFNAAVTYHRAGSAASHLSADRVADDLRSAQPRVVVLSGITPALSDTAREATTAAARVAREIGATVVLDVNHRTRLWSTDEASTTLRGLLGFVDVVIGSPDEISLLASAVADLLALGPSTLVFKLGAAGSRLFTDEGNVEGPTDPVAVVDPVGAGDAFTAGLVSGLIDGLLPAEMLRRANLLGAAAVRHRGDWEGLPTRAELDALAGAVGADVVR